MKALIEKLPGVSIVYFGDTARLPYGDKGPAIISKYAHASIAFLKSCDVSLMVIACNTASAYVAEELKRSSSVPVVDVIVPSVEKACRFSASGRIAVLATWATIRSQCYQKLITATYPAAEITAVACPLLVPLIEEQMAEHPATTLIVGDYLRAVHAATADTVILGCTHYPLLRGAIARELGTETRIVDSASCCADHVCQLMGEEGKGVRIYERAPTYRFFVSDNVERFRRLALAFLPELSSDIEVGLIAHD